MPPSGIGGDGSSELTTWPTGRNGGGRKPPKKKSDSRCNCIDLARKCLLRCDYRRDRNDCWSG